MTFQIGAHVDPADPVGHALRIGARNLQTFIGDPQGWKKPVTAYPSGAAGFRADAAASGLPVYIHAPYVLNVASLNNRVRIPSRKLLQQQLDAAAEVGAVALIVHGGHVAKDEDPAIGFDNWRKCVEALDFAVPILIENTAGGSNAMARHLENIDRLWAAISTASGFEHVGFCLDTCHAHAAGIDLPGLTERVRAITGRIGLVHVNDSRDRAGSGADRHANLGKGTIDPLHLLEVCVTAEAPLLIETHGSEADEAADITWLAERLGAFEAD